MKDIPAFPHFSRSRQHSLDGYTVYQGIEEGMTLRDYFAAKAMQGFMADSFLQAEVDEFAARAYEMADAMLKARVAK